MSVVLEAAKWATVGADFRDSCLEFHTILYEAGTLEGANYEALKEAVNDELQRFAGDSKVTWEHAYMVCQIALRRHRENSAVIFAACFELVFAGGGS